MLRYTMDDVELAGLRFGISPLCELGLSLRALTEPSRYPLQLPWLRHTQEARRDVDTEVLTALIDTRQWTPDFLNPRPASPLTRIEDEFARLAAIDPAVFRRQLEAVHGTVPRVFAGDPHRAIERMLRGLEHYWQSCFQPYWGRMRTILEADIVFRGRQIAQNGLAAMLNNLGDSMSYADGVLSIDVMSPGDRTLPTAGLGITLVPTMFTRRGSSPVEDDEPPMVMYPARGQGAMWEAQPTGDADAVTNVLGRVRAALLTALAEPASSTELGLRFGVSTSAVNQHLRALRAVGLVTSTRYGHSVLYLRSELGDRLLNTGTA
jgi:DNA-binding transcriptional ArsR family regulator